MPIIKFKITDFFLNSYSSSTYNAGEIISLVEREMSFLPKPLTCKIEGNDIIVQYPEESDKNLAEAVRLAQRAAKHAAQGNNSKAIDVLKYVLELAPSLHTARRDLAMAYVEIDDVDSAINHLIEVLRLKPDDAWSYVVLANLYINRKSDIETGEKFIRKALEISPADSWALNSLATLSHQKGNEEEAIALFKRSIIANPKLPNPYYGKALTYDDMNQPDNALASLTELFENAAMQDARSRPVFYGARQMYEKLQFDLAEKNNSEAFKAVQTFKGEMEALSGYPIKIKEEDFDSKIGATIQMAWKHKRDYHLIKVRDSYPALLICHLESHELTHLKLESEARRVNKNHRCF